jgi:hypothetical protein
MAQRLRDYVPALKYGAKVQPEDIAGMVGQPVIGNIFYVDANAGSDTANSGRSWDDAYKTLGKAYSSAVTFNYDVIIVAPSANSVTVEASIVWAKSFITVMGATAPIPTAQRSRIGFGSTATTPCLSITGMGNRFINLKLVVEEDVNVLVSISGSRNYFYNVDFAGICNATTGDDTAARCVVIQNDGGENYFGSCNFGVDTVLNSAANAIVEIIGTTSNARNVFEDCTFKIVADNAGPRFVLFTGAYSAECTQIFRRCLFLNTRGGTTTLTVGMTIPASTNGKIILDGCAIIGVTDWADLYTSLYGCNMPDIATANAGFMEIIAT